MSGEPEMHIEFPWPQPEGVLETKTYTFPTALGKACLVTALLGDGTNIGALVDPEGNAKFFRCSPETGFALEEEGRGRWPVAISEPMEQTWSLTIEGKRKEIRLLIKQLEEWRSDHTPDVARVKELKGLKTTLRSERYIKGVEMERIKSALCDHPTCGHCRRVEAAMPDGGPFRSELAAPTQQKRGEGE